MRKALLYGAKMIPILWVVLHFACSPTEISTSSDSVDETVETEALETVEVKEGTPRNDRNKASILAYFDTLIENNHVLVGQHCGDGADATAAYFNDFVDVLADETGRHVGLVGADFGFFPSNNYPVQTLIDHWNEGGLVTVSWHVDNPFVNGYDVYWNSVENKNRINFKALLKDGAYTQAWINYRTELDKVAGALQKLRDAGVTVIWRPFHEMNGDFFWWGVNEYNNQQTNQEDFKRLWIDLYNTLKFDYGLDNLIWTYSVIPYVDWNAHVTAFYPGSDYVDLVGMDYYGVAPDFPDYEALKFLGKTVVMSESGPLDSGYGQWNMMDLVATLKGKAAYFLQWHSWSGAAVGIIDNKNSIEMMNSTEAITRDEL